MKLFTDITVRNFNPEQLRPQLSRIIRFGGISELEPICLIGISIINRLKNK